MNDYDREDEEPVVRTDEDLHEAGYRRVRDETEYDEEGVASSYSVWEHQLTGESYWRLEAVEAEGAVAESEGNPEKDFS